MLCRRKKVKQRRSVWYDLRRLAFGASESRCQQSRTICSAGLLCQSAASVMMQAVLPFSSAPAQLMLYGKY